MWERACQIGFPDIDVCCNTSRNEDIALGVHVLPCDTEITIFSVCRHDFSL